MKNSYINIYEELLKQSLLIPNLVTKANNKDNVFLIEFNQWLLDTEDKMKKNNISKCSEIAGLRSKIIASSNENSSKTSKRKREFSVATSIIYDAQSSLLEVLEPIEKRLEEARESIRQLLGIAYQTDMLNQNSDFTTMIQTLWNTFAKHEQLKALTAKILVLVNRSDALRILAEEIDISMIKDMSA